MSDVLGRFIVKLPNNINMMDDPRNFCEAFVEHFNACQRGDPAQEYHEEMVDAIEHEFRHISDPVMDVDGITDPNEYAQVVLVSETGPIGQFKPDALSQLCIAEITPFQMEVERASRDFFDAIGQPTPNTYFISLVGVGSSVTFEVRSK